MKNWDDLIITLLVLIFTFGGGIKELLRRKKSANRSRPYSPRRNMDAEEMDRQEPEERLEQEPVRPSPVSTTPIGEPQTWQEILEMLRPKAEPPREIFEPEAPQRTGGEATTQASRMPEAEDDEFREVGQSLKKEQPALTPLWIKDSPTDFLQVNPERSFHIKVINRNWRQAMVLTEILGMPKGLR